MLPHTLLNFLFWHILIFSVHQVLGVTSYANEFIDPDYILSKRYPESTSGAQLTIVQWADELAQEGPWSVMNKSVNPPSGDKHDYLSWAPYSWPNCDNVGNTTELPPEEVWTKCNYYTRDGLFNPDRLLVNNTGHFNAMADAIFFNGLAWAFKGEPSSIFSQRVASYIKTWFLDEATRMNPHLNFAQLKRGPDGQVGQHTGVLDLKCFAKIVSSILLLRKGNSPDWTPDLDGQMIAWTSTYIKWLETADIALGEAFATNNHGSFYYNQLASLKLLVNDPAGAVNVTNTFFSGIFLNQIDDKGEQPLEAARTRPYHYRAYNLAAMITNARISQYADPSSKPWNKTTTAGTNIKAALDFAITIPAEATDEQAWGPELHPDIASVASVYGDPQGNYAKLLRSLDLGYANEAYFLWNQPLAGTPTRSSDSGGTGKTGSATTSKGPKRTGSPQSEDNSAPKLRNSLLFLAFSMLSIYALNL